MRIEKPIFCQVMDWIHPEQFRRCVQRYDGNYRIRHFSCWDQFLAMSFAQMTYRDSLADIEVCLRSRQDKLYQMGFRSSVAHSTLADANSTRDWRIYYDLAQGLIARARRLYANEPLAVELAQTVYALDSRSCLVSEWPGLSGQMPRNLPFAFVWVYQSSSRTWQNRISAQRHPPLWLLP